MSWALGSALTLSGFWGCQTFLWTPCLGKYSRSFLIEQEVIYIKTEFKESFLLNFFVIQTVEKSLHENSKPKALPPVCGNLNKKRSEIVFGQSGNFDTRVDYPGFQFILHRN